MRAQNTKQSEQNVDLPLSTFYQKASRDPETTSSTALPLLGTSPTSGVTLHFPSFLTYLQLPLIKLTSPLLAPTGVSILSALLLWEKKTPLQTETGWLLSFQHRKCLSHANLGWELSILLKNSNARIMVSIWSPGPSSSHVSLASALALAAIITYVKESNSTHIVVPTVPTPKRPPRDLIGCKKEGELLWVNSALSVHLMQKQSRRDLEQHWVGAFIEVRQGGTWGIPKLQIYRLDWLKPWSGVSGLRWLANLGLENFSLSRTSEVACPFLIGLFLFGEVFMVFPVTRVKVRSSHVPLTKLGCILLRSLCYGFSSTKSWVSQYIMPHTTLL